MTIRQIASRLTSVLVSGNSAALREYDSFTSALNDSDSYEDPRLVGLVLEKTERYRRNTFALKTISDRQTVQNMFVVLFVHGGPKLDVLEIGGACGASYFQLDQLLPERIGHWAVVETPAMVGAGKRLTDIGNLSFHAGCDSAMSQLTKKDLLIAQGVVQYVEDPTATLLELFALNFSFVYITRTVVAAGKDRALTTPVFTKQETLLSAHGPGSAPSGFIETAASQPLTIISLDSLSALLPPDYEVAYWFDESADRKLSIGERVITVRDVGFLAQKRKNHA